MIKQVSDELGCVERPDEGNPDEGAGDEIVLQVSFMVDVSWLGSGATRIWCVGIRKMAPMHVNNAREVPEYEIDAKELDFTNSIDITKDDSGCCRLWSQRVTERNKCNQT